MKNLAIRVRRMGLAAGWLTMMACGDDANDDGAETGGSDDVVLNDTGLISVTLAASAAEGADALKAAIDQDGDPVGMAFELDHQAAAQELMMDLGTSRLAVFGNPALGTPLMQENVLVGLDLPLKILSWEDAAGDAHASYDGTEYLRQRHALATVDAQLAQATNALANFASIAADREIGAMAGDATAVEERAGLVLTTSTFDATTTLERLRDAIDANAALQVFATIDHQAAAASVDLSMDFASLVIFGSAAVGTPLMQNQPSFGVDLPLKFLVAELDGEVVIAHNSPMFLAERHGVAGEDERLQMMAGASQALADAATSDD